MPARGDAANPCVVAGGGAGLDDQSTQQVRTRERAGATIEIDGDVLGAVQSPPGSCKLRRAQQPRHGAGGVSGAAYVDDRCPEPTGVAQLRQRDRIVGSQDLSENGTPRSPR